MCLVVPMNFDTNNKGRVAHRSQHGIRRAREVKSRHNQTTLGGASLRFLQGRGFFCTSGLGRLWSNSKKKGKKK
jgi:hypothetical protein